MKIVNIILSNNTSEKVIPFNLYETRCAGIWFNQVSTIDLTNYYRKYFHRGYNPSCNKTEENIVSIINRQIDIINERGYDLPKVSHIEDELTNELHHAFEEHGEDYKFKIAHNYHEFDDELNNAFLTLNETIHWIEYYLNTKVYADNKVFMKYKKFPSANLSCSWNPKKEWDLTREDFVTAKPFNHFGEFCLGYNTLGKNIMHKVRDKDFEEDVITPQTTFSNEWHVGLGTPPTEYSYIEYHKAWQEVVPEVEYGHFMDNREGMISIGSLSWQFLSEECTGLGINFDISVYDDFRVELDER